MSGVISSLIMIGMGGMGLLLIGLSDAKQYRTQHPEASRTDALKYVFYDNGIKKAYEEFVESYDKAMRSYVE